MLLKMHEKPYTSNNLIKGVPNAIEPSRSYKPSTVSGLETTVFKPLDFPVGVRHFQSFAGQSDIFFFLFDSDIASSQFFSRDGSCSGAQKRIKHHIAFIAGRQNEFGNQLFRFLGRMRRVFRH